MKGWRGVREEHCSTGSPKGHVCRDRVLPPLLGGRWKRGLCVTKTGVSETSVGRMGRCAMGAGLIRVEFEGEGGSGIVQLCSDRLQMSKRR